MRSSTRRYDLSFDPANRNCVGLRGCDFLGNAFSGERQDVSRRLICAEIERYKNGGYRHAAHKTKNSQPLLPKEFQALRSFHFSCARNDGSISPEFRCRLGLGD